MTFSLLRRTSSASMITLRRDSSRNILLMSVFCFTWVFCDAGLQSGVLYESVNDPASGQVVCGTNTPSDSYMGKSLIQCALVCDRFNGCSYFNHYGIDESQTVSRGLCQLLTSQPINLDNIPNCKLYMVSINTNIIAFYICLFCLGLSFVCLFIYPWTKYIHTARTKFSKLNFNMNRLAKANWRQLKEASYIIANAKTNLLNKKKSEPLVPLKTRNWAGSNNW